MGKTAASREDPVGRGRIAGAWVAVFTLIAAVPLAGLLPSPVGVIAACLALAGFVAALLFAVGREEEQAVGEAVEPVSGPVAHERTTNSSRQTAGGDATDEGLDGSSASASLPGATGDAVGTPRRAHEREDPAGAYLGLLKTYGNPEAQAVSRPRRRTIGGVIIVVAAAAVALVLALGGSFASKHAARRPLTATTSRPSRSGPFTLFRNSAFTAQVPQTWRSHVVTASRAGVTVSFADPAVPEFSVTAYVFRSQDTAKSRAVAIERRVRRHRGFKRLFWGFLRLRGGPQAWRLDYTVGGLGYAIYTFTTCSGRELVIVLGQARRASVRSLKLRLGFFAGSVRPFC